jgi:hypothetical protein
VNDVNVKKYLVRGVLDYIAIPTEHGGRMMKRRKFFAQLIGGVAGLFAFSKVSKAEVSTGLRDKAMGFMSVNEQLTAHESQLVDSFREHQGYLEKHPDSLLTKSLYSRSRRSGKTTALATYVRERQIVLGDSLAVCVAFPEADGVFHSFRETFRRLYPLGGEPRYHYPEVQIDPVGVTELYVDEYFMLPPDIREKLNCRVAVGTDPDATYDVSGLKILHGSRIKELSSMSQHKA